MPFDPDLISALTLAIFKKLTIQSSPKNNMLVVSVRSEQRSGHQFGSQDRSSTQASLLGRLPRERLCKVMQISDDCKNTFKAEACLLLWNEICSCYKIFWHQKGNNFKRKEAKPT
ncbi:hypothetical protein XENORESO_009602 [Xenotaenia resolanae]|uniref:Uncharacterized protein n=1 Tax=Xenotaenia resolanae TaxID=208358 RepID=A0ABV0W4K7_9TELE